MNKLKCPKCKGFSLKPLTSGCFANDSEFIQVTSFECRNKKCKYGFSVIGALEAIQIGKQKRRN